MTTADRLRLSCYRDIAELDADHGVFLVQEIKTKRIYVKKVLKVYDYQVYLRLKNEPVRGIPAVIELVRDENALVVIEQYCPGETLQEMSERKRILSEREVAEYMIQLCDILEALHTSAAPIVHRDIKPSNIIISDEGRLYLIDMNAAKFVNNQQDRDTRLLGTEGYAAPEQYGFGASTTQTDIYAIGVMMGELLTGSISGNISREGRMGRVIRRCTQMNPEDRFQSAAALKKSLQRFVTEGEQRQEVLYPYLPPGFRTMNPQNMLIAVTGYSGILFLGSTLEINRENLQPGALPLYRIYTTVLLLLIVLLSCNYLDVQRFFPPCRVRSPLMKLLAIVLLDVIVIVSSLILFGAILGIVA